MHDFRLLDNFLPHSFTDALEEQLSFGHHWQFSISASGLNKDWDPNDPNIFDSPQMIRPIYHQEQGIQSDLFHDIKTIFWFLEQNHGLKVIDIARIKSNLLLPLDNTGSYNPPHVDMQQHDKKYTSMIYYVNDSDGDTILFDKFEGQDCSNLNIAHRQTPKKGSAILFDSKRYHTSSNPVLSTHRIIVNFVLELQKLL